MDQALTDVAEHTEASSLPPEGADARPRWRRHPVVAAILALVVLLGLGLVAWLTVVSSSSAASRRPAPPAVTPELAFTVEPSDGAVDVPLNSRIGVSANGPIRAVTVTGPNGQPLPGGTLDPSGQSWASTALLAPASRYTVRVTVTTPAGETVERTSAFTTAQGKLLRGDILPLDGEQVGVGTPVVVRFNQPVSDRVAVQRALSLEMSQPVEGAWHWFTPREVHFRPRNYWPTGTQVILRANLSGVQAGPSLWGAADQVVRFRIGPTHESVIDVDAHTMVVKADGAVVRTMPQSSGRDKYPTMNGVHIVWGKQYDVLMDSSTVGIPRNSPDGYYQHVYWDVAISTGGEYVHSAPWSVGSQGRANVSHGCVNLSPANAQWFFNFSQRGDLVTVSGSPRPPSAEHGVADWNLPWDQWVAGDAVASAPQPADRRAM